MMPRHLPRIRVSLVVGAILWLGGPAFADLVPSPAQRAARDRAFGEWIVAAGHPCKHVLLSRKVPREEGGLPLGSTQHTFRVECSESSYFVYTEHLKPGHWVKPVPSAK